MAFRSKLGRSRSGRQSGQQKEGSKDSCRVNKQAIGEMFEKWADEPGLMTMEGIGAMADDLGMDPASDVRLLALCWRLGAKKPAQIEKDEWLTGMEQLNCDSQEALETVVVPSLDPRDLDFRTFRDFFKFVFLFSREGTHRTLEKDVVRDLLPIAICDRSPHVVPFLEFIETLPDTFRLTLDQWSSFLEFSQKVNTDFSNYDEDSAWPLLFDDYVDASKKSLDKKKTSTSS